MTDRTLSTPRATGEPATAPRAAADAPVGSRSARLASMLQRQGLLLLLAALFVFLWLASPYFLTVPNLLGVLAGVAPLGIMAVAQTPLIVARGLDISVGSVVAISSISLVLMSSAGVNVWLAALIAMVMGAAVGLVNGFLVIIVGINPLITTLGTMSIFSGLAFMISTSGAQAFTARDAAFSMLGNGKIGGYVPVPLVIFLVIAVVAFIIERRTATGRAVYAIGGNPEAARLAGLPIRRLPILLFVTSGLSAGAAGVILAAQLGAASPTVGTTFTLSVITAVILGGTSLAGGRGTVIGSVIAVVFLGVMQNGFTLLQVSSYAQTLILG
jgi:ribose transport system permease protein